jgi:hypothetical protein
MTLISQVRSYRIAFGHIRKTVGSLARYREDLRVALKGVYGLVAHVLQTML